MSYRIMQQNEYIASSVDELPKIAAEQKQLKREYPYGILVLIADGISKTEDGYFKYADVYCLEKDGSWTKI